MELTGISTANGGVPPLYQTKSPARAPQRRRWLAASRTGHPAHHTNCRSSRSRSRANAPSPRRRDSCIFCVLFECGLVLQELLASSCCGREASRRFPSGELRTSRNVTIAGSWAHKMRSGGAHAGVAAAPTGLNLAQKPRSRERKYHTCLLVGMLSLYRSTSVVSGTQGRHLPIIHLFAGIWVIGFTSAGAIERGEVDTCGIDRAIRIDG